MGMCLNPAYLDFIHVPSNTYADIISRDFEFPRERIIVATFGIEDRYGKWCGVSCPNNYSHEGYMMSIGRSNRDFDFLVNAWEGINYPLVVISDTWKPKGQLPANVEHLNNVAGKKQYPWIVHTKAVIIPIDDGNICSGDTVLLTAMSFAKNIIVTTPSTLGEMYVKDGVNGYLVEKDKEKFRGLINGIIDGEISDLGTAARDSFLEKFSRGSMGVNIGNALMRRK